MDYSPPVIVQSVLLLQLLEVLHLVCLRIFFAELELMASRIRPGCHVYYFGNGPIHQKVPTKRIRPLERVVDGYITDRRLGRSFQPGVSGYCSLHGRNKALTNVDGLPTSSPEGIQYSGLCPYLFLGVSCRPHHKTMLCW